MAKEPLFPKTRYARLRGGEFDNRIVEVNDDQISFQVISEEIETTLDGGQASLVLNYVLDESTKDNTFPTFVYQEILLYPNPANRIIS